MRKNEIYVAPKCVEHGSFVTRTLGTGSAATDESSFGSGHPAQDSEVSGTSGA